MKEGVWAIASHLEVGQLSTWMDGAHAAHAWTFRLPNATHDQALQMLQTMRAHAPWLAVHAEWQWATHCKADAIIAGSRSMPLPQLVDQACAEVCPMQVGAACHDAAELEAAAANGADFAFYSPIWETPSKAGILAPRGVLKLQEMAQQQWHRPSSGVGGNEPATLPLIALGGIETPEQVAACRRHGAQAVAVLRAARDAELLAEMVTAWQQTPAPSSKN